MSQELFASSWRVCTSSGACSVESFSDVLGVLLQLLIAPLKVSAVNQVNQKIAPDLTHDLTFS